MRPDPSLARDHEAGVRLVVLQMLEHEVLGTVGYELPGRFWPTYLNASRAGRDELEAVHAALERVEPTATTVASSPMTSLSRPSSPTPTWSSVAS
jgi:hypothetical protein